MEDVCDNLFNPDPYYQQGGDMVRVGGMDYACAPAESVGKRISDMTLDNGKQARGRQELQGRRLGFGQPAKRQAGVGRGGRLSAPRKDREAEEAQSGGAQRRGQQSGRGRIGGLTMTMALSRLALVVAVAALLLSPAAAQSPLPDKPFADHHLVLQLSDRAPDKQALVLSVAYNLLKAYGPDKIAHRGRGLRARHRSAARGKPQPRAGRQPDRARRAVRHLHEHRRHARARRQARRHQSEGGAGCRSASSASCN